MPLYELFCIAAHSPNNFRDTSLLIQNLSSRVLRQGGVIRDVKSLGVKVLPQRMRRHQMYHERGDQFTITFDTSPPVLASLNETLRVDPGVIRWTILKKGSTIKDLIPKGEFTMKYHPGTDSVARSDAKNA